jgi:hypothetical protein
MADVVLRVRFLSGELVDVRYDEPDAEDESAVVQRAIDTLADPTGVLRSVHGGRLMVIYARGVAAIEVAPRGAVL